MRLLALLLVTASLTANAGEHYTVSEGPQAAATAFALAAGHGVLQPEDGGSIRVWTRDYMLGRIQGFLISGKKTLWCRMSSTYANGVVSLGPAHCRAVRGRTAALEAINRLPPFSRSDWNCPLMDGGEVYVERLEGEKVVVVHVGNPDACEDSESRALAAALSKF